MTSKSKIEVIALQITAFMKCISWYAAVISCCANKLQNTQICARQYRRSLLKSPPNSLSVDSVWTQCRLSMVLLMRC